MSENLLPPIIKFHQNHRPAMDPGDYTVTIKGSISHPKITSNKKAPDYIQRFAVFGERFTLNDQDVRAVFPAAGSTGEYSSILPHVILNRNTLPWERHAFASNKDLPWLALLLFDEDETPEKKTAIVRDLWTPPANAGYFPALPRESAQHDDEKLTVIDVPKNVLQKILPSTASLKLLAHTRQGVAEDKKTLVGEENAVVFCNRLPEQGKRSTMHLVSVEGRYDVSGFIYAGSGNSIRLASLKSWEFYTIEHFKITTATLESLKGKAPARKLEKVSTLLDREFAGTEDHFLKEIADIVELEAIPEGYKQILIDNSEFDKTFDGLLKNLNKDILSLRLPKNKDTVSEKYLSQGLTPMRHHFRNGDRSVSWYRGPFLPYESSDGSTVRGLKPETADELIQYYEGQGMFDVTYSAAWEIGRLMALTNKDFSVNLYQWKRLVAQHVHKARQTGEHEHLPVFAHSHNHEQEAPLWERHLKPWLTQLANLQNIPGNYLVPDEKLLPKEPIRFFYVDKNWLTAALSGAFSVGGDWDRDSQTDDNAFTGFLDLGNAYLKGFLLRSDVVDGWPGLIIDGIDVNDNKLTPLRRQLSRDVLLCLFDAEFKQVVFHQKPEVMHFGLMKDNGHFKKAKRNAEGSELKGAGNVVDVVWKSNNKNARVIDINQLSIDLGTGSRPAQFAMNMIEGVPRVIFYMS